MVKLLFLQNKPNAARSRYVTRGDVWTHVSDFLLSFCSGTIFSDSLTF